MSVVLKTLSRLQQRSEQAGFDVTGNDADFAIKYLHHYGYLPEPASWNETVVAKAVRDFQKRVGTLKTDSQLGPKTLRRMQVARCGFPDVYRPDRHQHFLALKAFAQKQAAKWRKTGLRYAVEAYVGRIPQATQEQVFADAFRAWGHPHSSIVAQQVKMSEQHDIRISTGSSRREDFDGPGGTLAWAYLPDGSDSRLLMKFDLAETWILDAAQQGILLFNVACHEIGHLLGLVHSKVQTALMAPYYNAKIRVPQANDDVTRIAKLYPPGSPPPPPPPAPRRRGRPAHGQHPGRQPTERARLGLLGPGRPGVGGLDRR